MSEAERFNYDEVDDSSIFEFSIYKPRIVVLLLIVAKNF